MAVWLRIVSRGHLCRGYGLYQRGNTYPVMVGTGLDRGVMRPSIAVYVTPYRNPLSISALKDFRHAKSLVPPDMADVCASADS
jgi:hypothetical protein